MNTATPALDRTKRIVDRLLPELPASYTHPYPSPQSVRNAWAAMDRVSERKRLFKAIYPRMQAKVRAALVAAEARAAA